MKNHVRKRFGARLREALETLVKRPPKGYPSWLAQQLHVSPQAAGKWLRGESFPDMDRLSVLCGLIKVDANWLFSGEGTMRSSERWPFQFSVERFLRLTPGQRHRLENTLLGEIIDIEAGVRKFNE